MNNTMRNLTLSAAALAALVSLAPKADAQDWTHGRGVVGSPRGEFRGNGHGEYRGQESRGQERREFRGQERREFRGQDFRGQERGEFRGRELRGHEWGGRAFFRPPAFFGRGFVSPYRTYGAISPFHVYAGSRFYSSCPGDGYVYIANYGWVRPPYYGAEWVSGYYDDDDSWIEGCWR